MLNTIRKPYPHKRSTDLAIFGIIAIGIGSAFILKAFFTVIQVLW